MARIPQVGEPPWHTPSWLIKNYGGHLATVKYKGFELNHNYLINVPTKWSATPLYSYNNALVRVKLFDPLKLISSYGYDAYVIGSAYDGKVIHSKDGTLIEQGWCGINLDWLTLNPAPKKCNCPVNDLMIKGCVCGGM